MPDQVCSWCGRAGHAEDAHPLPKDDPDYDAFSDADDDELGYWNGRFEQGPS